MIAKRSTPELWPRQGYPKNMTLVLLLTTVISSHVATGFLPQRYASVIKPMGLQLPAFFDAKRRLGDRHSHLLSSLKDLDDDIPDESTLRKAYDSWRDYYGQRGPQKKAIPFDEERYGHFKDNYVALKKANIKSAEQAIQQGKTPPPPMQLNEYGDCSAAEYKRLTSAGNPASTPTSTATPSPAPATSPASLTPPPTSTPWNSDSSNVNGRGSEASSSGLGTAGGGAAPPPPQAKPSKSVDSMYSFVPPSSPQSNGFPYGSAPVQSGGGFNAEDGGKIGAVGTGGSSVNDEYPYYPPPPPPDGMAPGGAGMYSFVPPSPNGFQGGNPAMGNNFDADLAYLYSTPSFSGNFGQTPPAPPQQPPQPSLSAAEQDALERARKRHANIPKGAFDDDEFSKGKRRKHKIDFGEPVINGVGYTVGVNGASKSTTSMSGSGTNTRTSGSMTGIDKVNGSSKTKYATPGTMGANVNGNSGRPSYGQTNGANTGAGIGSYQAPRFDGSAPPGSTELDRVRAAYQEWCQFHGKTFEERRLATFRTHFLQMEKFCNEQGTELKRLNKYADLSQDEFKEKTKRGFDPEDYILEDKASKIESKEEFLTFGPRFGNEAPNGGPAIPGNAPMNSMGGVQGDLQGEQGIRMAYQEWCNRNGKTFEEARLPIFTSNFVAMEQYCVTQNIPVKPLNEFADLTANEYQAALQAKSAMGESIPSFNSAAASMPPPMVQPQNGQMPPPGMMDLGMMGGPGPMPGPDIGGTGGTIPPVSIAAGQKPPPNGANSFVPSQEQLGNSPQAGSAPENTAPKPDASKTEAQFKADAEARLKAFSAAKRKRNEEGEARLKRFADLKKEAQGIAKSQNITLEAATKQVFSNATQELERQNAELLAKAAKLDLVSGDEDIQLTEDEEKLLEALAAVKELTEDATMTKSTEKDAEVNEKTEDSTTGKSLETTDVKEPPRNDEDESEDHPTGIVDLSSLLNLEKETMETSPKKPKKQSDKPVSSDDEEGKKDTLDIAGAFRAISEPKQEKASKARKPVNPNHDMDARKTPPLTGKPARTAESEDETELKAKMREMEEKVKALELARKEAEEEARKMSEEAKKLKAEAEEKQKAASAAKRRIERDGDTKK